MSQNPSKYTGLTKSETKLEFISVQHLRNVAITMTPVCVCMLEIRVKFNVDQIMLLEKKNKLCLISIRD